MHVPTNNWYQRLRHAEVRLFLRHPWRSAIVGGVAAFVLVLMLGGSPVLAGALGSVWYVLCGLSNAWGPGRRLMERRVRQGG
jgi:hypothetical protein